jgi:hypothetical protein
MTKPSLLLAAFALAVLSAWSAPARADIPPGCNAYDALITCAAADVGKPCQGAGKCYEVGCSNGGDGEKLYKCDACPTIVGSSDECWEGNLGQPCGADGGGAVCKTLPYHCARNGKFACQTPATVKPTGPPAGSGAAGKSGGGKSSGCDIAPNPPKPTMIGLGLVVLGLVFFAVDRRRRGSRKQR